MMMLRPAPTGVCQRIVKDSEPEERDPNHSCQTSDTCVSRCAAYGRVCPCHARVAGERAENKMEEIIRNSAIFTDGKPWMRSVGPSEILLGEKLGEGGFCCVNACSLKDAPLEESLAIKYLRREIMVDRKPFCHGAADLANEAFFLATLNHPNIIKLHAVTAGNVDTNFSSGKDAGFFIVVDRLVETLEDRVGRWRSRVKEIPNSLFYRLSKEYKDTHRAMLKERLQVALEIANVFEYLHSKNILFRDLKPDNIGFNKEGELKLFDLGLAKEQKVGDANEDGTYNMTGHTGSRRYMAPEVAQKRPYNKSVDAFSFGILLWEVCSMEKPFEGYTSRKHMTEVIIGGQRPKMDSAHTAHWPVPLQWLMKRCWATDPEERPAFSVIRETLEGVLEELSSKKPEQHRSRTVGHTVEHGTFESLTSHIKKPTMRFGMGIKRARS